MADTDHTPLAVLKEARQRLADGGWITGSLAQDANGKNVLTTDSSACSFCAMGAIHAYRAGRTVAAKDDWDKREIREATFGAQDALEAVIKPAIEERHGEDDDVELYGVADWNDTIAESKEQVLAAFDEAIAGFEEVPA